ncbi:unnamed protein product [Rangifer tarandus platyrhynchus]|uniref:Uncharacterized protein n=1 Tax=Rangifer tarandus platyrhynchus TaxID=3082113 RepID=A0AC59YNF6_RANTA
MGIPSGGLRAGLTDSPPTPTREGRPFKAATRASAGLGVGVCDCRESRKPSPLSRHEGGLVPAQRLYPACPHACAALTSSALHHPRFPSEKEGGGEPPSLGQMGGCNPKRWPHSAGKGTDRTGCSISQNSLPGADCPDSVGKARQAPRTRAALVEPLCSRATCGSIHLLRRASRPATRSHCG